MSFPIPPLYLGLAPAFFICLGLLSAVDLGLGIKDGVNLSHEQLDPYYIVQYGHRPTGAATVPLVSTIYAVVETGFFAYGRSSRRIVASLTGAVLLLTGWMIQMAFWTNCEQIARDDNGMERFCPQFAMRKATVRADGLMTDVQLAKYAFGWILTIGYFAYMTFLAVLIDKARKAEKARAKEHTDSLEAGRLSIETK